MNNINKREKEIYNLYYTVLWTKYKSITLCYMYIIIFLHFVKFRWSDTCFFFGLTRTLFWAPLVTFDCLHCYYHHHLHRDHGHHRRCITQHHQGLSSCQPAHEKRWTLFISITRAKCLSWSGHKTPGPKYSIIPQYVADLASWDDWTCKPLLFPTLSSLLI